MDVSEYLEFFDWLFAQLYEAELNLKVLERRMAVTEVVYEKVVAPKFLKRSPVYKLMMDMDVNHSFTYDELRKIALHYTKVTSKSGKSALGRKDFATMLKLLGMDSRSTFINRLFDVFDSDGSGKIDMQEFLVALSLLVKDGKEISLERVIAF